ncbi:MAG TPA: SRPBCC family protein [Longimicrobiales bacterium]
MNNRKIVRYGVRALAVVVTLAAAVGVVGMVLPREHVAAVQIRLDQPPQQVFDVISDVSGALQWRSDLQDVEILIADDRPLQWRETTDWGSVVMAVEEYQPPARLVTRIDDPDQPFGGRWIFDLSATNGSTLLTITERGEVYNPFFRFMSRFVFGHYRTLESYARDLAKHLGSSSEPARMVR